MLRRQVHRVSAHKAGDPMPPTWCQLLIRDAWVLMFVQGLLTRIYLFSSQVWYFDNI